MALGKIKLVRFKHLDLNVLNIFYSPNSLFPSTAPVITNHNHFASMSWMGVLHRATQLRILFGDMSTSFYKENNSDIN